MTARAGFAALALGAALALAACGGGSSKPSAASRASQQAAGATVRSADCAQWRLLPSAERSSLLAAMKSIFGAPTDQPGARGTTLTDARATALFDGYCRARFARGFKLYKLYGRAAAFTPQP